MLFFWLILRAGFDAGAAGGLVLLEDHAGRQVGRGQEVVGGLRQTLDQDWRDVGADLRVLHRLAPSRADDRDLLGPRLALRWSESEVDRRGVAHGQCDGLALGDAVRVRDADLVFVGRQAGDRIAAVLQRGGLVLESAFLADGDDAQAGRRRVPAASDMALDGGGADLGLCRPGQQEHQRRCCGVATGLLQASHDSLPVEQQV